MNLIQKVCTDNPVWRYFSIKHQCQSLSFFSKKHLLSILKVLSLNIVPININKEHLIERIVRLFEKRCLELIIKSYSELLDLNYAKYCVVTKPFRSTIIAAIMLEEYGSEIFYSLCKPEESQLNINLTETCNLPLLNLDEMSSISYQCLSSAGIKPIFMQLHPAQRPTIAKNFNELLLCYPLVVDNPIIGRCIGVLR